MSKREHGAHSVSLAVSIVLHCPERLVLEKTLRSLGQALENSHNSLQGLAEIILVDHSRERLPVNWLDAFQKLAGPRARLVYDYAGANPGFGAGHNHAFSRVADADFFLVANPDLEFSPSSLAAGLAFFETHPDVGLLAPALIEPEGGLRPACFRYPDLITLLARLAGGTWARKRSYRYECRDWDPCETRLNPPLVSGCYMLFRSSLYAQLGGFDTRYFLYFEDFDLSVRANRLAHTAYLPAMKVNHQGGGAGRKGIRHVMLYFRSAFRFFSAHGWRAKKQSLSD